MDEVTTSCRFVLPFEEFRGVETLNIGRTQTRTQTRDVRNQQRTLSSRALENFLSLE